MTFDDLIWDYQDDIDKLDIPGDGISNFLSSLGDYEDGNGVIGSFVFFGDVGNPSSFFVVGAGDFLDATDFI